MWLVSCALHNIPDGLEFLCLLGCELVDNRARSKPGGLFKGFDGFGVFTLVTVGFAQTEVVDRVGGAGQTDGNLVLLLRFGRYASLEIHKAQRRVEHTFEGGFRLLKFFR